MNSRRPDHTTFREWLYLEPDGGLKAGERSILKQHLASCPGCRAELEQAKALDSLLSASRIEVDERFTAEVMSELPAASWEARSPRGWLAAAAVLLILAVGSLLLLAGSGAAASASVPIAALSAIWEMLASSALAGAGLLSASWKGLGLAIQDALGRSIWNVVAFGVLVLAVDLLLLRILLRRRPAEVEARDGNDS